MPNEPKNPTKKAEPQPHEQVGEGHDALEHLREEDRRRAWRQPDNSAYERNPDESAKGGKF